MKDALGHEITTDSAACAAALDAATSSYLGFKLDTGQHVNAARASRPREARQLIAEIRSARPAGGVPGLYRRIETQLPS